MTTDDATAPIERAPIERAPIETARAVVGTAAAAELYARWAADYDRDVFEVAGVTGRLQGTSGAGYGFTAILIALLGRLRPIGVLIAALGMSGLAIGFEAAQSDYDLPKSLVDVLRALIVVFLVAGDALVERKNAEAAR